MSETQDQNKELAFGQKAVGITFNAGGHVLVNSLKEKASVYIDALNELREFTTNGEVKRMLSIAITEAQSSQMWGVKAATWQY